MTTDIRLRAVWAAWATWACKRRESLHVRPTQVGLKGPGGKLPGLFFAVGQRFMLQGMAIGFFGQRHHGLQKTLLR